MADLNEESEGDQESGSSGRLHCEWLCVGRTGLHEVLLPGIQMHPVQHPTTNEQLPSALAGEGTVLCRVGTTTKGDVLL